MLRIVALCVQSNVCCVGGTQESWPDFLIGDLPNLYIYAANNPSESLLAKRRGYSTLVSHNVPPYARAGLYKDLANIKELVSEYRLERSVTAIPLICAVLERTGLYKDIPFATSASSFMLLEGLSFYPADGVLTSIRAEELLSGAEAPAFTEIFNEYSSRLFDYLLELENRIFSEGLHEIGGPVTSRSIFGYLQAIFGDDQDTNGKSESLDELVLYTIANEALKGVSAAKISRRAYLSNALAHTVADQKRFVKNKAASFEELQLIHDELNIRQKDVLRGSFRIGTGIHLDNLLDADAKVAISLWKRKSWQAALRYVGLLVRSAWGDDDAAQEIEVHYSCNMKALIKLFNSFCILSCRYLGLWTKAFSAKMERFYSRICKEVRLRELLTSPKCLSIIQGRRSIAF